VSKSLFIEDRHAIEFVFSSAAAAAFMFRSTAVTTILFMSVVSHCEPNVLDIAFRQMKSTDAAIVVALFPVFFAFSALCVFGHTSKCGVIAELGSVEGVVSAFRAHVVAPVNS